MNTEVPLTVGGEGERVCNEEEMSETLPLLLLVPHKRWRKSEGCPELVTLPTK